LINLKEIKNKILKKENFFSLIIVLLIFFIDRYSKIQIIKNFSENTFYLNNYVNIDLIWNTGIGFGILSFESNLYYNLISVLIGLIIAFLAYYVLILPKTNKYIFAIIIGGAIGNFYDRLYFRAVPDFIDLHYENFHWFTFNIADIFITSGIIVYVFIGTQTKE
tara:strand:- start:2916 stop:3407 length:492 start_codon:yes stop_codon:yes gene_type:complete